jgi:MFS family permease
MFGMAAIIQIGLGQVRDRRALLIGLPVMIFGVALVTLSIPLGSWAVLTAGAAVLGAGVGYAYMGSVTLIDRTAPPELRGEILSAYFVAGYLALAVPTIGIGLSAIIFGLPAAAAAFGIALAITVALLLGFLTRTPTPPGGEGRPHPG